MNRSGKARASISRQVLIRFAAISVIQVLVAIMFMFSSQNVSKAQESADLCNSNKQSFQQAAADHYSWAYQLTSSVAFGDQFTGSTDPTTCNFGKFIYSNEIQRDPSWSAFISAVEPLHDAIHNGASTIKGLSDRVEIERVCTEEIQPAITSLVSILNEQAALLDIDIAESQQQQQQAVMLQNIAIILQFVVLMLLIWFTYAYICREVVRPITEIAAKSEELAKGNLSLDFTTKCKNSDMQNLSSSLDKAMSEFRIYVGDISRAMGEISGRNLNVLPSQPFIGEFKPIEDSIGKMIVDLTSALRQIERASDQVSVNSSHVSASAQSLAQGATEQASSVQQLSASVTEVSGRITENAANTAKAVQMARRTSETVVASNSQMQELMSSMNEMNKCSKQINNIIKTIDDIAFQTNILALNAAVEAARAGTAGKGFAVVADEVRSLAGKSAEAAQNTASLIEHSISVITNGVTLAQATSENMQHVVDSVNQTAVIIDEIASATQEQANAITQINIGLDQISSVVQNNSATSEQSAAASIEMSNQAAELKELMGTFTLFEHTL